MYIKGIRFEKDRVDMTVYPYNIPVLKDFTELTLKEPVSFFVGENGSGKSTFIEAMAVACGLNPEGGSQNFLFETMSTHSPLWKDLTIIRDGQVPSTKYFLRAESFYNVASELERLVKDNNFAALEAHGGLLHNCSHGESFLQLVKNRFFPGGLYLLDEPEAALSPSRQMSLLLLIDELVKAGCQFIIATHSPILITYPQAKIYDFDQSLKEVSYRETGTYQTYQLFIDNPEGMIDRLLNETVE